METSQDDAPGTEILEILIKTESGEEDEFTIPVETVVKTDAEFENPQDNNEGLEEDESTIKIGNSDNNFLHFEFESKEDFISEEEQDPLLNISYNSTSSNNSSNYNGQNYQFLQSAPSSSSFSPSPLSTYLSAALLTSFDASRSGPKSRPSNKKKRRDVNEKPFKCPFKLCRSEFKWECQLRFHIRTHHSAPSFPCREQDCPRVFTNSHDRNCHETTHNKFECPHCRRRFQHEETLIVHLEIHNIIIGDVNNISNDNNNSLSEIEGVEVKLEQEVDEDYNNSLNEIQGVEVKVEPVDEDDNNSLSEVVTGELKSEDEDEDVDVKYELPSSSILETEEEIVNAVHKGGFCPRQRRYTCTCGLSYAHKCTLDRHLANYLSGRRFKCSTCAKAFESFEVFKTHLATHSSTATTTTTTKANILRRSRRPR